MKYKTAIIAFIAGLLVAAAIGSGLWFGSNRHTVATETGAAVTGAKTAGGSGADNDTGRKPLYWQDPMVPGQKFDKPGKSPFMDMQLVPVYADEGGNEGTVSISPRTVQNLGIRTAEVKQGNMKRAFTAVGVVSIDERSIATVQTRVNGYAEKLYVRALYDTVVRGQALAEIYSPDWLSAEEEYLALRRGDQPTMEPLAQAARQRLLLLGISEAQIARIERDGKANPRVTLSAPESGVVWELGIREGMAVNPGLTLFKLASLGTVWVNAEVPESQAALIKPGVAVEGRTAATPNKVFKGHVEALLPDVNQSTRTIKARIVLANPDRMLRPGMFASLTFAGTGQPALLVPSEAVISTGTRHVVVVVDGDGKFRPVDIEVGIEDNGQTEIRKGLAAGQKVVLSGQFLIDSEASLKGTLTRMEGSPPPEAAQKPLDHTMQGEINRNVKKDTKELSK
jgi:membrane fusion protein, copper/silver efflux system